MKPDEELPRVAEQRVRSIGGTSRVVRLDGAGVEMSWEATGRIVVTEHFPSGTREHVGEFDGSGEFRVVDLQDGRRTPALANTARTRSNPYGTAVEREEFAYFAVERTYDDDARLCRTTVTGDWGELAADVRTDGSRRLRWNLAAVDVEVIVGADGRAGDPVMRRLPKEHQ